MDIYTFSIRLLVALFAFNQAQKLTVLNTQSTRVNNYNALTQLTEQKNEQSGAILRIQSNFIQFGSSIYAFHGLSALADFPQFESIFNYTMTRFDDLKDASKLNRKPDKLKIVEAGVNGTLSDALTFQKMPAKRMTELALLNGMELTEKVSTGKLIKIIESQKRE